MPTVFELSGKVALVTGAAKGIGYETARLLHERGASVALVDLSQDEAEAAAATIGERTLGLEADVTDRAAMERVTATVVDRFGGIDVVVANAGIASPTEPMSVVSVDSFERVIDVDLYGVWRTVQPALGQVIERRGHIVVVASVYAFVNGAMATPYAMAKAGVEALGRSLRVELASHGASAGVAYFGFIDTDMVRDAFADPIARKVEDAFPAFMRRRLPPRAAAAAIVDGIESRAPWMIRPRWWGLWSALRGVMNPLVDRAILGEERITEAILAAEARAGESRAAERRP